MQEKPLAAQSSDDKKLKESSFRRKKINDFIWGLCLGGDINRSAETIFGYQPTI